MTGNIKILALRLLDRFDEHISARLLLLRYNRDRVSGPYFRLERGDLDLPYSTQYRFSG